ncbi:conserved hypothetical protein [Vibrio crassostreae]|uniref:Uncharacterized protein n=2 Tax=Vibrio TaxID=662 RepID=A0AB35N5U6_VIBSP|nr:MULTISPECIES: hypothetical protein [Vibrio]MDP2504063.1 hypothetical protein [Vibrio splendidus]OEE56785.1 hypothetical protein A146_03520 [Vibrio splendidus FF-500]OMO23708.1 hypothetical protein BH582_23545 [Vibrio sp. 10N.222.47.A9]PMM18204.1 hypothetical protein BCT62_24005 [Vibrio splendidus]PMN24764.1 hypothetical protein BCT36_13375 [Vibrio splendidus]
MINVYNPFNNSRLGGEGLSIADNRQISFARTDIENNIYSVEFPLQSSELSLVILKIAPLNPSSLSSFRHYLRYSITALTDDNRILRVQQATYTLGFSNARTSPIHTIVAPKGTTKIKVEMGSGFDVSVTKHGEVSFNESTS